MDDAFLVKFSSSGDLIWSRLTGSIGTDRGYALTRDNYGSVYFTGTSNSPSYDGQSTSGNYDVIITKFNSSGLRVWSRVVEGQSDADNGRDIVADDFGNIFITGETNSAIYDGALSAGNSDAFVTAFDSIGRKKWSRLLGGGSNDVARGIALHPSGSIYVTGYTNSEYFADDRTNGDDDVFLTNFRRGWKP